MKNEQYRYDIIMEKNEKPIVRLKPKSSLGPLLRGFPWVYDNELVLDRRTKAIPPGSIAILHSAERKPVGLVAFNPISKISVRILDLDLEAEIGLSWITDKISRAAKMRDRLYEQPYYRLVHAEADGLPGVVIDLFGDIAVIQPNAAWAEIMLEEICQAVLAVTKVKTILKNTAGRARKLEGLEGGNEVMYGTLPKDPVIVPMNGAKYMADLTTGQKTGLFYDQRPNHAFVATLSKDSRMLDMFCHVGGFGLAALAGGATSVLAVDGSKPALDLAEAGALQSGFKGLFATRKGDAFDVLTDLGQAAEKFDVVICDPPAFASSKQSLDAGLRAYEKLARLASQLVKEDGFLGLCSCSHAADIAKFRTASLRGIGRAGRTAALIHTGFAGPDHPQHSQLSESGYLKTLFFRL